MSLDAREHPALALLRRHGEAVTAHLRSLRARFGDAPEKLWEAIDYSLLAPGKRLRPTLVLASFDACGGNREQPGAKLAALTAAAALELIHTFSLVHDDLPAMDDDDLRRGRPTNHKMFGEAMAILAGDAMVTLAFEILATDCPAEIAPLLIKELTRASGPRGMIGGQVLDIASEGQSLDLPGLQEIHRMKTGALLTAACRMGAISAGVPADRLAALTAFGQHLGLAFQIVDDILDLTSTPVELGKATHKDLAKGKNTYPALMGLEAARQRAQGELAAALGAIGSLPRVEELGALARFVVERRN